MSTLNRRNFLKTSLYTGATLAWTAKSWAAVKGANDSIRVGVIGFNGRGQSHIKGYRDLAAEGVKIAGYCDVDQKVLDKQLADAGKKGEDAKGFTDMRVMLEKQQLDAVSIATPNHWHSLAAIWAIQAGKDVYCEKPVSNCVWEGRKIVEAARKYNRIVQTGTQSRSSANIAEAVKQIAAGKLGKVNIVRGLCYKRRDSIGKTDGPQEVPANINYDLWCGPAPLTPPRRNGGKGSIHYDWHWFWDYGAGDLGNQGIHQMDIARWFLGVNELSPRVWSIGGRVGYVDDAETPNTQIVYHEYKKAPLIFEVRGLPSEPVTADKPAKAEKDGKKGKKSKTETMDSYKGASIGVIVECENGYVSVPNYVSAIFYDNDGKKIQELKGGEEGNAHFDNFIAAVKSRKRSDLHAEIWEGHLSSALCHTGNISYRLGHKAAPGEMMEQLKSLKGIEESFGRMKEHLAKNNVDIESTKLTIGPVLDMDPKVEKFVGNLDADKLLRREYRAPYVVPDKV
ncbi:MAG: Gfo/Idh/MocA family oxidoreductase [Verrucomicrobia bacterium]|nr:Gfo/Idh/MocA family oxidoreductase [Verrucomicrobiota bacterium]